MQKLSYHLPALDRDTLAHLIEILAPYRAERITPTVMELALKLARLEVRQ